MKLFWPLLFTLLIHSSPGRAENLTFEEPENLSLFKSEDASQLLLVGFEDQSINRPSTISSVSNYRKRGKGYQSSSWSQRTSSQIADDYKLQKLTEWPMTEVGIQCVVYRAPTADSIPEAISRLSQDKRVKIVQPMHQFRTQSIEYNDPYYKLQGNMKQMQVDRVHAKSTGRNITIGIIDTGVDLDHPDLKGQILQNENFAESVSPSFSSDKHGTAVAGIMVAHQNNGTGIIGVAPNAKVIALKACWPNEKEGMTAICNSYTLSLAVNTAIKSNVKILNMSLAGPKDPLLELLLNKAIDQGIIVIASHTDENEGNENFPASLKGVLSVRSDSQHAADTSPENPSIAAPGENILTTLPNGTYDFISGSSMAAAQVSGIIALMLELKPDLKLDEIKSFLIKSEMSENLNQLSAINAHDAISALCKIVGCPNGEA